ncbi:uncharacterized protein TM35_000041840 [Trypanosoma theileri]|uniref:Uncharacterized protein n=1 Tax=Trypanosoma theileri TaxID=67003 RepID=A0A1X0P6B4_9TRYP|nr:uncharacterized protein TM35_000041840 [Trypanosoma theileri]ORC91970.1 hypothetical protein TM35_000041840 [Trypanosoma theileri]
MGCGASSSGPAPVEKKASTLIGGRGRGKEKNPNGSTTATPIDSSSRRGEEYDPIAVAAANPAAVTITDYRGLQVTAVNASQNKVNTVCRWADTVLGIREKNGGWFGEPPGELATMCRSESSFCGDDASSSIRPETGSQYQNRLEVSVYYTGELPSVRHTGRAHTPQHLERIQSPSKNLEKESSVEKPEAKEGPSDVGGFHIVKRPVLVDMTPNINKIHTTNGLPSSKGLGSSDSFESLKKLQGPQSIIVEELHSKKTSHVLRHFVD